MKITFSGMLFLLLLTLKLVGVIDMAWVWVTAPLWGGLVIVIVGVVCWKIIRRALGW